MPPAIAIVGVSVELPSGSYSTENLDHASFFEFLLSSGEAYEPIPAERFNLDAWKGTGVGKVHVDRGAFLKDIDLFDNVEFGISSKDAQSMAPATRKLLENSFIALLDSGIDYRMKNIGCFTSGTSIDLSNVSEPDEFDARGSFAGYPSMIANRISNHLDLLGPSVPVDTACSSTLTAMHLAVQAINNGDCEAAVVGGCQLNHRFIDWITYSQGSLLAKDGKCKPFDSAADGFARAEGCVVVVIKPLADALRDNDHIYATILGTAINSTGSAAAPGAPVAESQRDAMIQAFQRAGRNPRDVDYVELHATGTAKGDPTEANWVGEHFHREDELIIGSVKGNIGHTEITAFVASLSKVISIFRTRTIPPRVNIQELNPAIRWDEYRLRVPEYSTPLPCRSNDKSLVSIACSGIGGSNGHVVLESPPPVIVVCRIGGAQSKRPALIMTGGLSSRATDAISESIKKDIDQYLSDLPGLSTVLGRRSKQATWRSYSIVDVDHKFLSEFVTPQHCARKPNSLIWVFSGQGPQHKDMGRELFEAFPAFRQSILEMDDVFRKVTGKSIVYDHGLFGGSSSLNLPEIWPISLVLPSIAIFQMALFDLLSSLNVKPDVVVGHSAGEAAVLYASGAAPKAMAVELAIIRGKSFTPTEELGGTMAAVSCTPDEMETHLQERRKAYPESVVDIACFNTPSAVAIAGHENVIDLIVGDFEARGTFVRKIRTRVPFHSSMMESSKSMYTSALKDLFARYPGPHCPQIPTYSTLTGDLFKSSFDADYFWDNTRSPVRFTQVTEAILAATPNATFLEFAPHPVLASYIMSMAEDSSVFHAVQRPKRGSLPTEHIDILHLCGKLTLAGHNSVDFTVLNERTCSEFTPALPRYPFSKKKYPLYPETMGVAKQMEVPRGPLNHRYLRMNKDTHPTLAEHVIRGEPIMAAAGFLEMALEFGATTLMNVNLRSILSLSADKPVQVDVSLDGAYWAVKSIATNKSQRGSGLSTQNDRLHADGYLSFEAPEPCTPLDIQLIRTRCPNHIGSGFYPSLSYFSAYGPRFQRVTNMYYGENEALASIKGMDSVLSEDGNYLFHPAILDAAIQVSAYKPFHGDYDPNVYFLPAHLDAVIIHQKSKPSYFPSHLYAHVKLKKWIPNAMCYDISLVDDSGARLCTFKGLEVAKHHINPFADTSRPFELVSQPVFHSPRLSVGGSCEQGDRSSLFGTLDKLTIRAKMLQKAGKSIISTAPKAPMPNMDSQWSAFLQTLDATSTLPACEGPQFETAISCSVRGLRNALCALSSSGTKMVSILVVSNVKADVFRNGVVQVLNEFPTLYAELTVDNKYDPQNSMKLSSGITRTTKVDWADIGTSNLADQIFDVVLLFNTVDGVVDPETILSSVQPLLVPGGTLILTERNREAWDQDSLGTMWYNAVFGTPSPSETYTLSSYMEMCKRFEMSTLHVQYSEDIDPFHFTMEVQKKAWSSQTNPPSTLFDPADAFVYEYVQGGEIDLQWELSGLNVLQNLDIWITATEGRDGGAAYGLVRAMRREYSSWTIRLVIFPASYDEDMRQDLLQKVPMELRMERDLVVSSDRPNTFLVPRLVPIPSPSFAFNAENALQDTKNLPPDHVVLLPLSVSNQAEVTGFVASVVVGNQTGFAEGSIVVGLTNMTIEKSMVVDVASIAPLPKTFVAEAPIIAALIPGFAAAVIAPGLSTFSRPCRLRSLRILLTHADTAIGTTIQTVLSRRSARFTEATQNISLYQLTKLQNEPYDLIISGYTDHSYTQVLNTLLKPIGGKLFSWADKMAGLAARLHVDPCSVGDALRYAMEVMETHLASVRLPTSMLPSPMCHLQHQEKNSGTPRALFDTRKTYLILGGIGTIGAHLALFMYQRGARRIVLTSRSGKESLQTNPNVVVRRIFDYLAKLEDLQISLEAVDATDSPGMTSLIDTIGPSNLGGCMILTAALSDRIFRHLNEDEFSKVFSAKIGVLDTLKEVVDVHALEFLVAFTSVSGMFGFGGQTNYGAANTALEEAIGSLSNAFSFVCPGVLDSTLMLAGTGEANESRLSYLIPWSFSAEDMMRWFDDAMIRFQNGQRLTRYLPDLNWEALERTQGVPGLGQHLVPSQVVELSGDIDDTARMAEIVRGVLDIPLDDFSPSIPLTAYGIDSLSASRISFLLRPFVEVTQIQLLADLSLNDLQRTQVSDSDILPADDQQDQKRLPSRSKSDLMNDMVMKYSTLSEITISPTALPSSASPHSFAGEVVLITGTTGTLGSNTLSSLLQNDDISLVYALNRPQGGGTNLSDKHRATFTRQGLPVSLLDSPKLVLLEGDLTAEHFGLQEEVREKLLSSITHIIHNAWTVDFVTSLSDHEDLIKGTRNLLDFAHHSMRPTKPSLSYVSTIGIFQNFKEVAYDGPAPEEPVLDPKVSVQTGYIESKWVAERLFQGAAEKYDLRTNVIRVGLLTGGANGSWDPSQWFPAIAQSAAYLGCLPGGDDIISWLPVDLAAAAIVDMRSTTNDTLHLIHPKPVTWESVMQPLAEILNVPLVPYEEWFARLESSARDSDEESKDKSRSQQQHSRAALRMTHFYRLALKASSAGYTESMGLLARVASEKGVSASATLQSDEIPPLGRGDVEKWVAFWREIGFLPL
ncbi:hypothetical protein B0H34DRAFT_540683 [Crassisporium funariophilum]|nr:hypothetical protein B0H34DRAFT_540683 [Crassisporium funariophilum]